MSEWTELAPRGPVKDWADHDRTKRGQAWSRKWVKPHPTNEGMFLTVEISIWPCQSRDRRWFTCEHRFQLWKGHPDGHDDDPTTVYPIKSSAPGEHVDPSAEDGPANEPWPTDADIRTELIRIREPAPWDGSW